MTKNPNKTMTTDCEVRIAVIRKTDSMFVGSVPAMVGMVTRFNGDGGPTIAKLNAKTVTYANGDRESRGIMVNLGEARRFDWPNAKGCLPNPNLKPIREPR